VVLLAAPVGCQPGFACYAGFGAVPLLGEIHDGLGWLIGKTNQGPLRYLHFLATAYLAYVAVGPHGRRLRGRAVDLTRMVGRQTLAVFLVGLVVAQVAGMAMDAFGRDLGTSLLVNAAGCLVLVAAAKVTETFKSPPWRKAHPGTKSGTSGTVHASGRDEASSDSRQAA
jgi:peptidoglycan/LPS O-acetylase OafA/YrhL